MKSFTLVLLAAALSTAAPITITHTAPAVTVVATSFNTVGTTEIKTVTNAPPGETAANTQTTSSSSSEATTAAETNNTPAESSTNTPTTSTSATSTPAATTSTPAATTPATTSTTPTSSTPATTSSTSSTSSSSSAAPSSSGSGATNINNDYQFNNDILSEHNAKRALHGVQSLVWDDKLATYAKNYADTKFDCNNVQLIHSGGPYGENLAAGYDGGISPVDAWYNEIKQYDFSKPGFSEATGHFTQLVWKSTGHLGCARVTCNNEWRQYTICEYSDQRGNVVGTNLQGQNLFEVNVVPPIN